MCLFCPGEICWSWNCQVIAVPVAGPEAKHGKKAVASGRMAGEDRSRIPPTKAQWWCLLLSKSNRNSLDFQVSNVSNVCKGFYSSRCSSLSGDGLHLEIIKIFSQDTSSQDPARKVCRIEATVSVPRHELRKFLQEEQFAELWKLLHPAVWPLFEYDRICMLGQMWPDYHACSTFQDWKSTLSGTFGMCVPVHWSHS